MVRTQPGEDRVEELAAPVPVGGLQHRDAARRVRLLERDGGEASEEALGAQRRWVVAVEQPLQPGVSAELAPEYTPLGEIFTTWMSTDPTNKVNVQLRAGGGLGDTPQPGSPAYPCSPARSL